MTSTKLHCLKRVGDNVKKYKLIILDGKDEVTVGRNPDVTVCILSTMISRCHAVLKKAENGEWSIKDNKSLNGVYVNDVKLEPLAWHVLHEGDVVQLGVRPKPELPPEFVYKYYTALKVTKARKAEDTVDGATPGKRIKTDHIQQVNQSNNKSKDPSSTPRAPSPSRSGRGCSPAALPGPGRGCSPAALPGPGRGCSPAALPGPSRAPQHSPSRVPQHSPYDNYRKKMDEQKMEAAAKTAELEAKLKEMQELLQEKESAQREMAEKLMEEKTQRQKQSKVVETLKQKEEQLQKDLVRKQELLAKEKEELELKMKEELEDQLQMREAELIENLETQKQALLKEKLDVEERLKTELESEREKDKKLAEELLHQKEKLHKVIEAKEAEQKLLETQLRDTRQEKDQKQEEVLRAREDILSNFADLMETELQCSICNELFVKATTLNCSHGFCSLCIAQWMKVKKECPQCRAAIVTHMRSIVLDSYIEKMVEQFSEDMKKRRQELVDERKGEEAAFEEANRPKPPEPARGRGRGRGGRVRGRGRRGNMAAPPPPPSPPTPVPMLISDDDDDEDRYLSLSDSDRSLSDSDDISGDEGAYFGGYGRCYSCGGRGHWANGCPYR